MPNSQLLIRPARPEDVKLAVAVLRSSMDGLADYLYSGDPQRSVDEYIGAMYQLGGHRFSWDISFVGEAEGQSVGFLLSYPGQWISRLQMALLSKLPSLYGWRGAARVLGRLLPLANALETEADEYYISNIGVLPEFQGRSYGTQLMAFAETKAREAGLSKCSLSVDEHNEGALRLYERLGYKIVFSKHFEGKVAEQESGYHRMVKQLDSELS